MKLLVTGCCGFIGSNFYFNENRKVEIINLDAMGWNIPTERVV